MKEEIRANIVQSIQCLSSVAWLLREELTQDNCEMYIDIESMVKNLIKIHKKMIEKNVEVERTNETDTIVCPF